MTLQMLDNPAWLETLFFPRQAQSSAGEGFQDGTIPVEADVVIGYRLWVNYPDKPTILYYHGNGEIAADYNFIAPEFRRIGVNLLIVDYRGYGWSTGTPTFTSLLADVKPVREALPDVLQAVGKGALFVMGRSLGSAPAIEMAYLYPDDFKGLIVESGFATIVPLLVRRGIPADSFRETEPVGNRRKVAELAMPLLIIHGEQDQLIAVEEGEAIYDASPATLKRILRIANAGHNNLLRAADRYFSAIADFIAEALA